MAGGGAGAKRGVPLVVRDSGRAAECVRMSTADAASCLELPDLAATTALAGRVAGLASPGDAILLDGPLGAGKTTFARAFLRHAAGEPALEVPSPSFTLVQTYDTRLGPVHHFDLWRLDGPGGLIELGWDEALRDVVLVEWSDRLGPLRPATALEVALRLGAGEGRRAMLSGWPGRVSRLR